MSSILTANRLWKNYGSFVLTNIRSESIKKLIEISKLDGILTLIPTMEESVDYVYMEDMERELDEEE
ncbi:MAG: hypothetical protein U0T81_17550 [Saprospiraceae bacterium]